MYKVVINGCYGGFGLSPLALEMLHDKYPEMISVYENCRGEEDMYLVDEVERHDKRLVEVVEKLGSEEASGDCARLVVTEVSSPMYRVSEYDGYESIETPDNLDWTVIAE